MSPIQEQAITVIEQTDQRLAYIHFLYYLALHGPVSKKTYVRELYTFLNDIGLLTAEDREPLKGRAGEGKIHQSIRNLNSHRIIEGSDFIVSEGDTYVLKKDIQAAILKYIHERAKLPGLPKGATPNSTRDGRSIILFGPPGTGKTRYALLLAAGMIDDSEEVTSYPHAISTLRNAPHQFLKTQFHPGYTYEDFVEGLRPVRNRNVDSAEISFELVDGPFKAACALASNQVILPLTKVAKDSYQVSDWVKNLFKVSFEFKLSGEDVETPPGVDFDTKDLVKNSYVTWYPFGKGAAPKSVVLIIDEINRGDAPRVFGEILTAMEREYRSHKELSIHLQHSKLALTIPNNLSIVATMNTADRSLAHLDQAFRRRFEFIELVPHLDLLTDNYLRKIVALSGDDKEDVVTTLSETIPDMINKTASFIGSLIEEINGYIDSPERHFGHSFGLKAMDRLLRCPLLRTAVESGEAEQIKKAYSFECKRTIGELWFHELLPQIRLIPSLWGSDHVCRLLEALGDREKESSPLSEVLIQFHDTSLLNKNVGFKFWSEPKVGTKNLHGIVELSKLETVSLKFLSSISGNGTPTTSTITPKSQVDDEASESIPKREAE